MDANDIARYTVKDTVFRDLFRDSKNLLELYRALHPESTDVTEDEIEPITLETVMVADLYNDVGFRVRDKIFILVEAQTTWSMNILVRMFMYLAETYNNYFRETRQSLYDTKKVSFPKPELYVVYTGDRGNKRDEIKLSEEFLNGEKSSLEVKAKVLFDTEHRDIISQYIKFTRIYNEQVAIYGRKRKAVIEAIRICKNEDVLKEYLSKRETEVVTIMMSLFDMEYIFNSYVDSKERQAEEKGEVKGRIEGAIDTTIRMCKEFGVSLIDTIKKVATDFGLSENEAERKVREYWN